MKTEPNFVVVWRANSGMTAEEGQRRWIPARRERGGLAVLSSVLPASGSGLKYSPASDGWRSALVFDDRGQTIL